MTASENYRPAAPGGFASVHLDMIRGLAAIAVLLNHWRFFSFVDYHQVAHSGLPLSAAYFLTGFGPQSVMIFFVLSGYLVGGSVIRLMLRGAWRWTDYCKARLTRLYIVLVPALLLGAFLDHLSLASSGTASARFIASGNFALDLPTFLANMLFLQTIKTSVLGSNDPLWSLSNEFWYYMAFPVLVGLLRRDLRWWHKSISAAMLTGICAFVGSSIRLYFAVWLLGALLGGMRTLPPLRSRVTRRLIVATLLTAIAAVLTRSRFMPAFLFEWELILGLLLCAFILAIVSWPGDRLPDWYRHAAKYLAGSAYTVYLVHYPVMTFFFSVFRMDVIDPSTSNAAAIMRAGSLLVCTYGIAMFMWFLFERNTDQFRRWIDSLLAPSVRTATQA